MMRLSLALGAALAIAAGAQAAEPRSSHATFPKEECADVDGLQFLCGVANAEDMVLAPGGRWIVTGGLGPRNGVGPPGGLRIIDVKTKVWRTAYPTWPSFYPADPVNQPSRAAEFPGCAGPPDPASLAIHGLAVRQPAAGPAMIYAVNHGKDERIEAFELREARSGPALVWVGCVVAPKPLALNSVAVLADGTIFATVFRNPGEELETVRSGAVTGGVYRWTAGGGAFTKLPLQLSGPNGIEVSPDGKTLYFAEFGAKRVSAYARDDLSRRIGVAQFNDFWPDNIRWDSRGRLVAAGMNHNYNDCVDVPWPMTGAAPACARAYAVEAIDPRSFRSTRLAAGATHPAFSNVATGLVVGRELWMGAYNADRVAVRPVGAAGR